MPFLGYSSIILTLHWHSGVQSANTAEMVGDRGYYKTPHNKKFVVVAFVKEIIVSIP